MSFLKLKEQLLLQTQLVNVACWVVRKVKKLYYEDVLRLRLFKGLKKLWSKYLFLKLVHFQRVRLTFYNGNGARYIDNHTRAVELKRIKFEKFFEQISQFDCSSCMPSALQRNFSSDSCRFKGLILHALKFTDFDQILLLSFIQYLDVLDNWVFFTYR